MQFLRLCQDLFYDYEIPLGRNFRSMLKKLRKLFNNDCKFAKCLFSVICGRGYNEFMDYSLMAIKFNAMFQDIDVDDSAWYGKEGDTGDIKKLITNLLWDDRHDLWQNAPYQLDRIYIDVKNAKDKEAFWLRVADIMVDCINVHGTEDVSVSFIIKE